MSNRLLGNQIGYKYSAVNYWLRLLNQGDVTLQSNILDMGSGCGRFPVVLRDSAYLDSKFTFKTKVGNYYLESVKFPEAAVAYHEAFIAQLCTQIGFSSVRFINNTPQSLLYCKK